MSDISDDVLFYPESTKYIRDEDDVLYSEFLNEAGVNDGDEEEMCGFAKDVVYALYVNKPFGLNWSHDNMLKFLTGRGYKIVSRPVGGNAFVVLALKDGEELPESIESTNVRSVFSDELQKAIIEKLLDKENENTNRDKDRGASYSEDKS